MRYVTIITAIDTNTAEFNKGYMTDSQALHSLLVQIDPGEEYTVKFSNKRPRGSRTKPNYQY